MDATEVCFMSAAQLGALLKKKDLSPVEVVEAHLARIEALEPTLNSFITLMADEARADARRAEAEIQGGKYRGPLHGVPLGLKDLYHVRGVRNTSGAKIYESFVPEQDCTIMERFREAGAILMGKLNLPQFAYSPVGENPDYGNMHNPWDPSRITGGSSGGSGSAAVAGQCTITMGSDTGGSIRIPSALCGVAGLKPTYGRLSRHGLSPLCWSMDHPGPMTRTVEDCALVMNVVAGRDPKDPSTVDLPVPDYTRALTGNIQGLRVGVPKEYFEVPCDPQVERAVRRAIELLGELGAEVREVSWPMYHYAAAISTVVIMAESTACYGEVARTHGTEIAPATRLRIEGGFFVSGADYVQANRARAQFVRQTRELLDQVDVLAGPSEPITAFPIGDTRVQVGETTMGTTAALTQYSRPFNLNGFPAISVPCGFSDEGLPIGLQLAGRPFAEETVLRSAHAYEQATEWHTRRPPL